MRIISLNIWGGKLKPRLLEFFRGRADQTDFFCLQEVFDNGKTTRPIYKMENMNVFAEIQAELPNHDGFFAPSEGNEEGLAIFYRKGIEVREMGDVFCFRWKDAMENDDSKTLGRNLQYISFVSRGNNFLICNFHGLWNGINKLDSEDRIKQSENIIKFLNDRSEFSKVLCGDFNLLPDTKSIRMFEEAGLRNLIREFGVTSTRTSFYTKLVKFAGYVFISNEVRLKDFKVLPDEVSDHSPLLIEVE